MSTRTTGSGALATAASVLLAACSSGGGGGSAGATAGSDRIGESAPVAGAVAFGTVTGFGRRPVNSAAYT